MSKQLVAHPDRYLKANQSVSITLPMPGAELPATIIKITPDQIWLELVSVVSDPPFQEGASVRVKHLTAVAVHYFDARVLQIWGPENRYVAVCKPSVGVLLERRIAFRTKSPISLAFTVIGAKNRQLVGEKRTNACTEDIGVGGLKFDTDLILSTGDELEINLRLSDSQVVNAVGWVVRSESIGSGGQDSCSVAVRFFQLEANEQKHLLAFLAGSQVGLQ